MNKQFYKEINSMFPSGIFDRFMKKYFSFYK